jgi:hypothetical protein
MSGSAGDPAVPFSPRLGAFWIERRLRMAHVGGISQPEEGGVWHKDQRLPHSRTGARRLTTGGRGAFPHRLHSSTA